MTAASQRRVICAGCGTEFGCGAGGDGRCWCAEEGFLLPMPTSPEQDCLCPTCLRAKAREMGVEVRS